VGDIDSGPICAAIPGWFQPPAGLDAIRATYGEIEVANGAVVTPGWESANMIMAHEAWMPAGKLYVNKKIWPILKAAIETCLALNDGYLIKTLGCFSPRAQRGANSSILSTHSWGIAVDLNADDNPLTFPPADMVKTIPDTWIATFESCGFTWGGRFKNRHDPMHFQLCSSY